MITLLVGPNEEKFVVHGTQLKSTSDFFVAALKKEWAEGQERTVKLPEEDPTMLTHYLAFAYDGSISDVKAIPEPFEDCEALQDHFTHLCNLYLVGERLQDKNIRNRIIDKFFELTRLSDSDNCSYYPSGAEAKIIYGGTTAGAPMRRLLIDTTVATGRESWVDDGDDLDPQWVRDVAKGLLRAVSVYDELEEFRCEDLTAEDYYV